MRYCTLLMDFDGTLFDTRNAIRLTLAQLTDRRGVAAFDCAAVDAVIDQGLALAEMLRRLVPEASVGGLDEWIDDYRAIYNGGLGVVHSAPYPGVEAVLQRVHRRGIEMFIVSNKGLASVLASLEHYRLRRYFREVIAAVDERPPKPEPESFLAQVKPLIGNQRSEQVLVVGDTEVDLRYARNIGASSCWAAYGYGQEAGAQWPSPDFVIQAPEDLLEVVLQEGK